MKRNILLWILFIFLYGVAMLNAQNQIYTDSLGKKYLVGTFTWEEWQKEMNWKLDSSFKIDESKIELLSKIIKVKNITFNIFGGSWCGDTHTELPKIIEIFSKAGVESKNFTLFGVDRKKFEPSYTFVEFQIEKVPTLIILSQGKEIGRIVEFPEKDWLTDILNIISGQ